MSGARRIDCLQFLHCLLVAVDPKRNHAAVAVAPPKGGNWAQTVLARATYVWQLCCLLHVAAAA